MQLLLHKVTLNLTIALQSVHEKSVVNIPVAMNSKIIRGMKVVTVTSSQWGFREKDCARFRQTCHF